MAAGDTLGIAISGLLAFQRALATTSHNITNVNTEGYSRQRPDLVNRPPQFSGAGYIGTGIDVTNVRRVYDNFLASQVRIGTSIHSQLAKFHGLARQVDNLVADPEAGLAPALQDFFSAVQGVANNPTSGPARQVLLSEGQSLVDRFRHISGRISDLEAAINTELQNSVNEVNGLAQAIADLNRGIILVRFDGGGLWSVIRLSDNTTQTGAGPFSVDGLTITVGGAPAVGDTFLVQPTASGAETLTVSITGTSEIAAAAPIRTEVSIANQGSAQISAGTVNTPPPPDPNLQQTVTTTFNNPPTDFDVNGVGTGNPTGVPYVDGSSITFNGWTVQITGSPAAGDTFTISANTNGVSDNRNALLLAGLQTQATLAGNTVTYEGALGQLVADVGSQTHLADVNREAQSVLLNQAIAAHEGVSGVNLDEEAANLLQFQQAYQAAAQLIAAADLIFQSLISALRR